MLFSTNSKRSISLLLEYFNPVQTAEGYTLSVNKVAVDYISKGPDTLTALGRLLDNLPIRYASSTKP